MAIHNDLSKGVASSLGKIEVKLKAGIGKKELAKLRSCAGKNPDTNLDVYNIILSGFAKDSKSFYSGKPTIKEKAAFVAMTLFAYYQQGTDYKEKNLNSREFEEDKITTLIGALAKNCKDYKSYEKNKRLLEKLLESKTLEQLNISLYRIISNIKKEERIPVNFIVLAQQVYRWQIDRDRQKIIIRWQREFTENSEESPQSVDPL